MLTVLTVGLAFCLFFCLRLSVLRPVCLFVFLCVLCSLHIQSTQHQSSSNCLCSILIFHYVNLFLLICICCWQPLDVELRDAQSWTYGLKAQVGVIGGVPPGFVTGIHKDSVHRWNLRFPSAGVFAEVLAGRAMLMQITFPHYVKTTVTPHLLMLAQLGVIIRS